MFLPGLLALTHVQCWGASWLVKTVGLFQESPFAPSSLLNIAKYRAVFSEFELPEPTAAARRVPSELVQADC